MTNIEIQEALAKIAAPFGKDATSRVFLEAGDNRKKDGKFHASVWFYVKTQFKTFDVTGNTIEEAVTALRIEAESRHVGMASEIIRQMAMAIINATADTGSCNNAALRVAGFSDHDISLHGSAACAEANQIASNGPFSIEDGVPVLANGGGEE